MKYINNGSFHYIVTGCLHGCWEQLYLEASQIEKDKGICLSAIFVCGDSKTARTKEDLTSLACPPRYRTMGSFHKYSDGTQVAPYLTILISGNHECSEFLLQTTYGGWIAPNIYYLGFSGSVILMKEVRKGKDVVSVDFLRVSGISGIGHSILSSPHKESVPLRGVSQLKGVYQHRKLDTDMMCCMYSKLNEWSDDESSLDNPLF
ncbi:hypothetical protein ADUPG1_010849, partial [Aduncisulcus paluster]